VDLGRPAPTRSSTSPSSVKHVWTEEDPLKIVYTGPHDEVDVPGLQITARHGESVEIEDAVAKELLAQGGPWAKAGQKAKEDADR
jgi:hypothetical protein